VISVNTPHISRFSASTQSSAGIALIL